MNFKIYCLENQEKTLIAASSCHQNHELTQETSNHQANDSSSPSSWIKSKSRLASNGPASLDSTENENPTLSRSIKPEGQESTILSRPGKENANETEVGTVSNNGLRCINNIFSGYTKLKRLLGTLVEFANNISSEIGDTVRMLVLNLLVNTVPIIIIKISLICINYIEIIFFFSERRINSRGISYGFARGH